MDFSAISRYLSLLVLAVHYIFLQVNGNIEHHPASVVVSEGEYANFTCSIDCTDHVSMRWRLAAPRLGDMPLNKRYFKTRPLKRMWGRQGITISTETNISQSSGCKVVTIKILATSELNGAVIQCAASATRQDVRSSYSKFAVMQVEQVQSEGSGLRDETTILG